MEESPRMTVNPGFHPPLTSKEIDAPDLTVYLTVRDSGEVTVSMVLAHTFTGERIIFLQE